MLRKLLPFTCLFMFIVLHAVAQNTGLKWAKAMGSTNDDAGTVIAADAVGNVYTAGLFKQSFDVDPGPAVLTFTSSGNQDIFISKSDSNGHLIWAKKIGGPYDEYVNFICMDDAGYFYITGFFSGTVDFDPGPGVVTLATGGVADNDSYLAKYDTSGNLVWAKHIGGSQNDYGYAVALDPAHHVYCTGSFRGTVDFDPGSGVSNLTAAGNYDIYVARFDSSGNFNWAKAMGGTGIDYGFSIALDAAANVYTTGTFSGTADFDPGAATYALTAFGGTLDEDIFISKLDSLGNFIWAQRIGGANYDQGNAIVADASGVYTSGYFWGTVDFNPGSGVYNMTALSADDAFVCKLDANGNFKWAKQFGSTGFNGSTSVLLDAGSNVYTCGTFNGTVDFDPGNGVYNLTSAGNTDVFISKLDSSGNFIWAKRLGGTGNESAELGMGSNGNLYLSGEFTTTADLDPNAAIFNASTNGGYDIFYERLGPCNPSSSTQNQTACNYYTWNSTTYSLSGTYTQTISNVSGCDSVMTLLLTIHNSDTNQIIQSACSSYLLNGQTYTSTGVYWCCI